jgi:hypothetical protein
MFVAQNRPADAQHQRPVPLHQRSKGHLSRLAGLGSEPLQELPVGQLSSSARIKENPELP